MVKSKIPDRWLIYSAMGAVIPHTRFLACKVPLREGLVNKLPEKKRFGPKDLVKAYPNIALLIDLTNTTRYYLKEEFTAKNIQYEKIFCPGHVVPPNSILEKFFTVVDEFLASQRDPEGVIAVHCTHGVNRTGYFICRYMIQRMKMTPEKAIESFQIARGHNIERQNYIEDLKNCCKGGLESDLLLTPFGDRNRKAFQRKRSTAVRTRDDANFTETLNYSDRMYPPQNYNNNYQRPRNTYVRNRNDSEIYRGHISAGPRDNFFPGSNYHFSTRDIFSALSQERFLGEPRNHVLDRPRKQEFDGPKRQSFAETRSEKRIESDKRSKINNQASWRMECRYQSPLDETNSNNHVHNKNTYPPPIPSQSSHFRPPPSFSSPYKWPRDSSRAQKTQPPPLVHQGSHPFSRPLPNFRHSNHLNAGAHTPRIPGEFRGEYSPQFHFPPPPSVNSTPSHPRVNKRTYGGVTNEENISGRKKRKIARLNKEKESRWRNISVR